VIAPLGVDEVELFRDILVRRLGLQFDDTKIGYLGEVLRRRLEASGGSSDGYLARLDREGPKQEVQALAEALTVPETYFFRNIDQFRAFAEVVLPERVAQGGARRALRVLSAGCASGEEPYTIAMLARAAAPELPCEIAIRAVDLNPEPLRRAGRGRFTSWSLRETPPEMQRRWFRAEGSDYILDENVRALVKLEQRNLIDDDPELWQPGTYDAIFCRNVLMYFSAQAAQATIARITGALVQGGYLFLGHAETLRGLSHDFHLRHTHGTFYYQRRGNGERAAAPPPAWPAAPTPSPAPALAAALAGTGSWVEAIHSAASRIQALASAPASPAAAGGAAVGGWDLGRALDLLRQEQFAAALDLVRALPSGSLRDPEVLLLRAVLLSHSGQVTAAEETCRTLLALDELNAGAHYVLALCREGARDPDGAADHDQVAAYLDPAFAMPRLHLGLLARRAGDRAGARRELAQALLLLQREDASRLLLFGGGFTREALTTVCRTELLAAGGRP
jgi:chemotaxis protein methyltransferase CheR